MQRYSRLACDVDDDEEAQLRRAEDGDLEMPPCEDAGLWSTPLGATLDARSVRPQGDRSISIQYYEW